MVTRVIVLSSAALELRKTVAYVRKEFGEVAASKFKKRVSHTLLLLANNPNMGVIDDSLSDDEQTYRSIFIPQKTKLIYTKQGGCIHVVMFWNTNQNNTTIKRKLTNLFKPK